MSAKNVIVKVLCCEGILCICVASGHVVEQDRVHNRMFHKTYLHISEKKTQQLAQREHNRVSGMVEMQGILQ